MIKKKGFTLIELLAVIVILGVLAAIAIPQITKTLNNSRRNALISEADIMIRAAKTAALTNPTTRCYTLDFLTNNKYITKDLTGYSGSIEYDRDLNKYKIYLSHDGILIDGKDYNHLTAEFNTTEASTTCEPLTDYKESNNIEVPRLDYGMIPVTISSTGVVTKANVKEEWYDYTNKEWANAVVVKSNTRKTYQDAEPNTTITAADILGYFVWIPRYKYTLFATNTSANAIAITFEKQSTAKSTGTTTGTDLTHPAFTFGDKELPGFWIGKFETTVTPGSACAGNRTEANCKNENPTILPDTLSLINQNVSTQFDTAKKMQSDTYGIDSDSHMAKNNEWGAVAYLSHSIYGQCNNLTTCTEVRRNNNSGLKTGYGAVNVATTGNSATSIATNEFGTSSEITQPWNTITGMLASTTGNITGVYDMSGGTFEHVMGVYGESAIIPYTSACDYYNSGYNGKYGNPSFDANCTSSLTHKTDAKAFPLIKYYQVYYIGHTSNKGDALAETAGWYGDSASYSNANYSWSLRGGYYNYGSIAGVFHFNRFYGIATGSYSFRVVLAP